MSKRMTKMEACHHLTVLRDHLAREIERRRETIRAESGRTDIPRRLEWEHERIAVCEVQIRALEMAGTGLTR